MKINKIIIVIVVLILAAGGIYKVKTRKQEIAALPMPQPAIPAVRTAPVKEGTLEQTSHYLGSVEAVTISDVSARISGNILNISKREGDTVRQGELLVVIDDRELADRAMAVNAEVLATQQKLAGAQSAYATQKSVYERDATLYKAGAISKEALERSKASLDGTKALVDATGESIIGLQRNTAAARTQTGYAKLTAPFSGIVAKRWSEPGDMAVPGKPILTIQKTSPYKVLAQVPQEELKNVKKGDMVYLKNGEQSVTASINKIYPALSKNLLATVEVITQMAPFGLPTGSTVGFDLVVGKHKGIIVPDNAVVHSSKGMAVYLVKDGVVHIVPVKLLDSGNGMATVAGELHAGDTVAVGQENSLLTLTEGMKVTQTGGAL